jgi:hypothetical protein
MFNNTINKVTAVFVTVSLNLKDLYWQSNYKFQLLI